jgi:hypothetical protein
MMGYAGLFIVSTILGGVGGALGSMGGHAFGSPGLYAGGVIGGLVGAVLGVRISALARWIQRAAFPRAAVGAAIGFLIAALIAVNSLSSPVGPFLSSLLIGLGAVIGAKTSRAEDVDRTTAS